MASISCLLLNCSFGVNNLAAVARISCLYIGNQDFFNEIMCTTINLCDLGCTQQNLSFHLCLEYGPELTSPETDVKIKMMCVTSITLPLPTMFTSMHYITRVAYHLPGQSYPHAVLFPHVFVAKRNNWDQNCNVTHDRMSNKFICASAIL